VWVSAASRPEAANLTNLYAKLGTAGQRRALPERRQAAGWPPGPLPQGETTVQEVHSRYTSLRDYIALVRRQRMIILVVVAVFALGGLGISLAQSPTYTAQGSVSFRDLGQALQLINSQAGVTELPGERAAREALIIEGLPTARRAKRILGTKLSPETLSNAVSAQVGLSTNLVNIQAEWKEPRFAARLANAFAQAAIRQANRSQRSQLVATIKSLKTKLKRLPRLSVNAQVTRGTMTQLQAIAKIIQAGQLTQRATAPSSPSSPRPVLNTVLGLIVGLAFGFLAAFVRDSLDRKIRTSRDAHEELGYPILGRIGEGALGSGALSGRNGQPMSAVDIESFRLLRTNLAFFDPEKRPRTILVTSGIAGEGKSTVAASLAATAVTAGQRTLLVDGDLRKPMLDQRLGLARSPGLSEYLVGGAEPKDILQLCSLSANGHGSSPPVRPALTRRGRNREAEPDAAPSEPGAEQLVCITSGAPPPRSTELLASSRCQTFLEKVSKVYDLVVIDSSPLLASVDPLELIPYVDVVLICVRTSWSTRDEARAVRAALSRLPERPTGIVVTGLHKDGHGYGYYGYEYG
jgi:succinoglycan biosynthesis transport protein ExoP